MSVQFEIKALSSMSVTNQGNSSLWYLGYQKSVKSLEYTGDQLTLTTQDNTQFSVTITSGGGGDFVPIAGNEGNPMTGDLIIKAIRIGTASRRNVVIGNYAAPTYDVSEGTFENTIVGWGAFMSSQSGSERNVCLGNNAGADITTGRSNIMQGPFSGGGVKSGNNNICITTNSQDITTNEAVSKIIAIGTDVQINNNYEIAIGGGGTPVIQGLSAWNFEGLDNYIKINGLFNVKDWQFKQVTAGLNIYFQGTFKARIGTDGDLYLAGTTTHYNATE